MRLLKSQVAWKASLAAQQTNAKIHHKEEVCRRDMTPTYVLVCIAQGIGSQDAFSQ